MSEPLPRSTPEAQGVASDALQTWLDALAGDEHHSFMLLRHGSVIAEGAWTPFTLERPHQMWSLSKSFTSIAAGLAIAEGHFALSDRVVDRFTAYLPEEVSPNLAAMTVRDLLIMGTGHETEAAHWPGLGPDDDWRRRFLAHPVVRPPGTHFFYNSLATYMVSALIQDRTGQRLTEYLTPRLFAPLGLETPRSLQDPHGVDTGGWGLFLPTEAIAKFGQLLLQRGQWEGRQLVPSGWVDEATSAQIDNSAERSGDWAAGYGYQFWRCVPSGVYRGDGAFGQYMVVMPEYDAVLAMTSAVHDMGQVLQTTWDFLLPALTDAPLPASASAEAHVARCAGLKLESPASTAEAPWTGPRTFRLDPNDEGFQALTVTPGEAETTLTWTRNDIPWTVTLPERIWAMTEQDGEPVAVTGSWHDGGVFRARVRWLDWGGGEDSSLVYSADGTLRIDRERRGIFGGETTPALIGHLD